MGDQALAAGDNSRAEAAYARAAYNVDWGLLGDAAKSGSLFNLANTKLRLGKFSEAEQLLLESLKIEQRITKSDDPRVHKRFIGLAMVYRSLDQYEKGLPFARETFKYSDSPEKYGDIKWRKIYDWYAAKLEGAGRVDEAKPFHTDTKLSVTTQT
jgi:tetratricopeptide (TPR) repeat protein